MSQQEKKIFSSVHINRITVEFKFLRVSLYYPFSSILIESQWNLNSFVHSRNLDRESILIESQWNLNGNFSQQAKTATNINRITVEFKSCTEDFACRID